MQYITLNKTLELENKIQDLILISIDDQIDTIDDKDGVRINGKINVSGSAKTNEGNKDFLEIIDIDIFVTYEELVDRNSLSVSINDFNYKVDENKLMLDISLKISGLKEIETTFLAQEDNELLFEEEVERVSREEEVDKQVFIDEKIDIIKEENKEEEIIKDIEEDMEIEEVIEAEVKKEIEIKRENTKKSLLKSVFANKRIKEDISWKLHCVRGESTYEQIAIKYNVNVNKLIAINNNEKLEEGKLIFLPLD